MSADTHRPPLNAVPSQSSKDPSPAQIQLASSSAFFPTPGVVPNIHANPQTGSPTAYELGKRRRLSEDDISMSDLNIQPATRRVRFRSPSPCDDHNLAGQPVPAIESSSGQTEELRQRAIRKPTALNRKRERSVDDNMSETSRAASSVPENSSPPTTKPNHQPLLPLISSTRKSKSFSQSKKTKGQSTADIMHLLQPLEREQLLSILVELISRHPRIAQSDLPRLIPATQTINASLLRIHHLRDRALGAFPYTTLGRIRDAYAYSRVKENISELYECIRSDSFLIFSVLDDSTSDMSSQHFTQLFEFLERVLRCIEQVPEGKWDLAVKEADEARWEIWSELVREYASKTIQTAGAYARSNQRLTKTDIWRWAEWLSRWNQVSDGQLAELVKLFEQQLGWIMRGLPAPPPS